MPQMAPMSWIVLFMLFSITFMVFIIMNYFVSLKTPSNILLISKTSSIKTWKW
uniref:ATP synthase F0 subunit 8 n=1 Tax=Cantonius szechuanensis TaxID=3045900 RepID=UPI00257E897D|nr:ATP synthase F0 subunit 8 [Cantonius szechuanensis]WHE42524.1 ATP synthase F0 subunit 8 [Cantonius szechuanensis]